MFISSRIKNKIEKEFRGKSFFSTSDIAKINNIIRNEKGLDKSFTKKFESEPMFIPNRK